MNPMDLTGKRILITGASSGIGREVAVTVSKLGGEAVIVARRKEMLMETLSLLDGSEHGTYCADLSNLELIENLIAEMVKTYGKFDGFVHSAGVAPMRPLRQLKFDHVDSTMKINLYAFIEIVRCIAKRSSLNEGASIVGISSVASIQGSKSKIAYCASKSGMDSAIRCMAKELSPRSIRVNSVQPGWVDTIMLRQYLDGYGESDYAKNSFQRQYLGPSLPSEIANVVAFLLSDATKTITGTSILIDGGSLS